MITLKYLTSLILAGLIAGVLFVYSGIYPMGADVPHGRLSYEILTVLREQSIKNAATDIAPPLLSGSDLLLAGGADYNDMCASCHLTPGQKNSDLSIGLYPAPPNLTLRAQGHGHGDAEESIKRQFWIIKHGIKASGMPAWGPTHDDERIWSMVAFLQKLPDLTPEQYQILTARGDSEGGHH